MAGSATALMSSQEWDGGVRHSALNRRDDATAKRTDPDTDSCSQAAAHRGKSSAAAAGSAGKRRIRRRRDRDETERVELYDHPEHRVFHQVPPVRVFLGMRRIIGQNVGQEEIRPGFVGLDLLQPVAEHFAVVFSIVHRLRFVVGLFHLAAVRIDLRGCAP